MRHAHYIKWTKGMRQPPSIVAVQVAARTRMTGEKTAVDTMAAWAIHWTDERSSKGIRIREWVGTTADQFWGRIAEIAHTGGQHWIVANNCLQSLTLLEFWERLEEDKMELCGDDWRTQQSEGGDSVGRGAGYCVTEDPPTAIFARVPLQPGRIILLDWRNFGAGPLPEDLEPEKPGRQPAKWASARASWIASKMGWLKSELDRLKLGKLQFTHGSQAMYSWKFACLDQTVICHNDPLALALERSALYGGRNEVYKIGRVNGPVYELDFRSFYPEICSRAYLPGVLEYHYVEKKNSDQDVPSEWVRTAAEVTLRTDNPAFPFRRRPEDTEVIFPVGKFRTFLCGPELELAAEMGVIESVHQHSVYALTPCLSAFARLTLQMRGQYREEGNDAGVHWAKSLGVSLPGKLGQRWRRWVDEPDASPHAPYCQWINQSDDRKYRAIAWRTQVEDCEGEHPESVPAIAAWVTSLGRVQLWRALCTARRENCYYADTDSLFCNEEGAELLQAAGLIGTGEPGLLLAKAIHEWAEFYGLKWYKTPEKEVCSGSQKGIIGKAESLHAAWWSGGMSEATAKEQRPSATKILRKYSRHGGYAYGTVHADGRITPLEVWE